MLYRYFKYIKQEMEAHLCWGVGCCDFPMTPPRIVALTRQILPEDALLCLDNGLYKVCRPSSCSITRWLSCACLILYHGQCFLQVSSQIQSIFPGMVIRLGTG